MAHKALQWMGGATTTVVLAACYGGYDMKYDSGYRPTPGTTTGNTNTGTPTGTTSTSTTPCGGNGTIFAVTVFWTDVDGAPPSDSDGDGTNDTDCTSDTLETCLVDPLGVTDWNLGMAEDGAGGWTGEDCFNGYAGYNHCHPFTLPEQLLLTQVCTPAEVVPGSTTLLDASKDAFTTYYLEDSAGACFVFGTDPAYYSTLGCTEML